MRVVCTSFLTVNVFTLLEHLVECLFMWKPGILVVVAEFDCCPWYHTQTHPCSITKIMVRKGIHAHKAKECACLYPIAMWDDIHARHEQRKSERGGGNQATNRLGCCVLLFFPPSILLSLAVSLSPFPFFPSPSDPSLVLYICCMCAFLNVFLSLSLPFSPSLSPHLLTSFLPSSAPSTHHIHLLLCLLLYPFFLHDKKVTKAPSFLLVTASQRINSCWRVFVCVACSHYFFFLGRLNSRPLLKHFQSSRRTPNLIANECTNAPFFLFFFCCSLSPMSS